MANYTLITNSATGEIVGGAHGHVGHKPGTEGLTAGIQAGEGQSIEHVDIPDSLLKIKDPDEFHSSLKSHLGK